MNNLKEKLDELVKKYETPEFIKNDPIQFLHRFEKKQDIEIAGLIASSFAYGKREAFIEKLNYIFKILGSSPHNFVLNINQDECNYYFENFKYRFNTGLDVCLLLQTLSRIYKNNEDLEKFIVNSSINNIDIAKSTVNIISKELRKNINAKSYAYLFPSPEQNSACKRLNLFLKWMVRKSPVDIGIWNCLKSKDLIIPLDVHVAKVSRNLNLTKRKSNDWITAEEITAKLREFDFNDPVKYDFALFDIGLEKIKI